MVPSSARPAQRKEKRDLLEKAIVAWNKNMKKTVAAREDVHGGLT